jgi:predicted enzyme related to lactoylglutathione lyase
MPRVVYFDISADDVKRAIRFYEEVFGWKIEKWSGPFDHWNVRTGEPSEPGIDGGLAKRENPSDSITNIIDVPSVDEFSAKIAAKGGKIVQPKMAIPGVGYLVIFKDTEGNTMGIMEGDESVQ